MARPLDDGCLQTQNIAARCEVCGAYQMHGLHLVELKFYCKEHCKVHRQAEIEWRGEVVTVKGEQESLFG